MSDLQELYNKEDTSEDIAKINVLSTEELLENFDGGVQKSKMKIIFLIFILLALFLVMFY
jgi:hypothetical protein